MLELNEVSTLRIYYLHGPEIMLHRNAYNKTQISGVKLHHGLNILGLGLKKSSDFLYRVHPT